MGGAAIPPPTWVWGVALVLLAGCGTTASAVRSTPSSRLPAPLAPRPEAAPPAVLGREESGQGSWYGRPHHGRRTASDEVFDMHALTAAHRTLPFGTRVRVTHVTTGRAVEVRINDRGPWRGGRIIDVSYAAAQRLGAVGAGIFPVTVRVVALPDGTREAPAAGGRTTPQPASRAR